MDDNLKIGDFVQSIHKKKWFGVVKKINQYSNELTVLQILDSNTNKIRNRKLVRQNVNLFISAQHKVFKYRTKLHFMDLGNNREYTKNGQLKFYSLEKCLEKWNIWAKQCCMWEDYADLEIFDNVEDYFNKHSKSIKIN